MAKIILAEDDRDIRDILATIIEAEFSCEIIQVESGNSAIDILKRTDDILAIVSDYNMPDGTGGIIHEYNKVNKNLPLVVVSGGFLEDYDDLGDLLEINPANRYINKPVNFDSFIEKLAPALKVDGPKSSFCKVTSSLLEKFPPIDFDIYLKINDEKFIKIKNKGDSNLEEIERYKEKTENQFFITGSDFPVYMRGVVLSHQEKLLSQAASVSEVEYCGYTLEILRESLVTIGITESQIELVGTTIELCISKLEKDKNVKDRLELFLKESGHFVCHAITSIHVAVSIARGIGLSEETTMEKIAYAGLLHDLGLGEASNYSSLVNLESSEFVELNSKLKTKIKTHPHVSSDLFEHVNRVPSDTLSIIREHHEYPNGTGFPRGLVEGHLSLLGLIFSMSIIISDHMFFNGTSSDSISVLLNKLRNLGYDQGSCKKLYDEFKKIALKEG